MPATSNRARPEDILLTVSKIPEASVRLLLEEDKKDEEDEDDELGEGLEVKVDDDKLGSEDVAESELVSSACSL